jgi:type I restriction enzyme S subunit
VVDKMKKTPKFRFPEFSGEWEKKTLGDVYKLSTGNTPSRAQFDYYNGEIHWTTSGELKNKYVTNTYEKITEKAVKECNLNIYKKGTVIIAIYGLEAEETRGSCSILDIKSAISQACMAFTQDSQITNEFFYYWYCKYGELIGLKYAQGTKQQNLNGELISSLSINIPLEPEQEKIISFLSLIDKKIKKQQEKVEALDEYKKGIMHKIFSKEIRFNDEFGNSYVDWTEMKLKECINHFGGTALESLVVENGEYKFISIGNYDKSGNYIDNGQRINASGKAKEKILDKNDLVMVLNDKTSTGDIIGSTILINEDNTYIYNQRSERIKCNKGIVPKYIWFVLNSTSFRKKVFSITQGGTQIYVNFPSVKELTISIPCILEQEKISVFLSIINEKLYKEQEKLDNLKQFRKGLLQQILV